MAASLLECAPNSAESTERKGWVGRTSSKAVMVVYVGLEGLGCGGQGQKHWILKVEETKRQRRSINQTRRASI